MNNVDQENFISSDETSISSVSTKNLIFNCDKCGKSFTSLQRLRLHMSTHMMKYASRSKYVVKFCHICGHVCNTERSFKNHILRHKVNLNFSLFQFISNRQIIKSILRIYFQEENAYPCTQCPKKFSSKKHLDGHLVIHSNKRPFVCQICGSSFKYKQVLTGHLRSVHYKTRPKNHECKVCNKKFYSSYKLAIHMRSHTGEVRNRFCSKSFHSRLFFSYRNPMLVNIAKWLILRRMIC